MSWFKGFTSLFSGDQIFSLANRVGDGLDAAWFTDEEKANHAKEMGALKVQIMDAAKPYKVAQRIIAVSFTFNFIAIFWAGFILIIAEQKDMMENFINWAATMQMGWIMLVIIAWYFKYEGIQFPSIGGKK